MSVWAKNQGSPEARGRGEGWVAAQFALFGLLLVAPHAGPRWPTPLTWAARLAALPLLLVGGYALLGGMRDLGPSFTPLPRPKEGSEGGALSRRGLYSQVRHPMYFGAILVGFGWAALTANTTRLLLAGGLLVLLSAKSDREETWLAERYPEYAAYRAEVPKLWPL